MEESDDESAASSPASDSERCRGEPAERPEGRAPEKTAPAAGAGRRAGFGARTTPAAPPLAGSLLAETAELPGGRTDTEGSGGLTDSEAAAVVLSDLEEAEPSETYANVHAFRKFVKRFGPQKFLERFLPPDVSGESIVQLLLSLGYVPRNLPPRVGAAHYVKLMRLLELAMGRICELRPRLENFCSVAHVLGALRTARNILVITGAGISTSLGIPDFRSSEGFYSKMAALGLEDPQEVFDIRVFHDNPMVFYSIAHMILPPKDVRAPLHRFLTLLQDKGKLLRNYTQNIDNIEANAGLRPEKMVQCHGSLASASCVTCRYQVEGTRLYPALEKGELAYCPRCDKKRLACMRRDDSADDPSFGVMKPDITFFGEDLPRAYHSQHARDLRDCDLLLSIGTSLRVAPVSDMVDKVAPHVPQVLINRDPIPSCNFDVSFLGYCDDTVSYLCDQLGRDWDIDHPDYRSIVGADRRNLEVHGTGEKGVFEVHNRARAAKLAAAAPKPAPGPDLVLLEPELP
ncbi:SIR2-domain-containing protein [Metschnikowia bicuspidata var. bicuspidata NRRL YB-4993]|uniref:SIR2-domain-containing protein n=1 Tax=Metschnikowia bicuspidata var. bicuspidata NRRL YB-4993 TaxID=869754 RepID=A0A1A0HFW8_9ASCO|nr:SIR2-domain-containing protein [Metschnikowia bicuspidata var. bicuspidata NRRL YB-4993]OBA22792.1 SIR2-domain-containing protein [Metschnikowia bicuspidata var. bicuspidata NRRL YB-4993]